MSDNNAAITITQTYLEELEQKLKNTRMSKDAAYRVNDNGMYHYFTNEEHGLMGAQDAVQVLLSKFENDDKRML